MNNEYMNKAITLMAAYDPNCYYNTTGEKCQFSYEAERGKKWINYGSDNRADLYIENLLDMNEDHGAILKKFSSMVAGQGFTQPTDPMAALMFANQPPVQKDPLTGKPIWQSKLIDNNYNNILSQVAWDLLLYGAFALCVRWGKGNIKIADVNYLPVRSVRWAKDRTNFYVSNDWSHYKKEEYTPVLYPAFTDNPTVSNTQILYVKLPNCTHKDYGIPYWWATRSAIECQQELLVWYNSHLKNGFNVDAVINYPEGFPEDEQLDRDHQTRMNFFQGGVSAKVLVVEKNMTVTPYQKSRLPDDLEHIQKVVNEKVKVGHGVVGKGELFGLAQQDGGMSFSDDSLTQEWRAFDALQVRPMQKVITDAFNLISRANGVDYKWAIDPYVLFPQASSPEVVAQPASTEVSAPVEPTNTPANV